MVSVVLFVFDKYATGTKVTQLVIQDPESKPLLFCNRERRGELSREDVGPEPGGGPVEVYKRA